jgi:hypothetical protein
MFKDKNPVWINKKQNKKIKKTSNNHQEEYKILMNIECCRTDDNIFGISVLHLLRKDLLQIHHPQGKKSSLIGQSR